MSIDQDYFSLPFINQRQASPLTCRDQHGRLHLLSKTQCLSTKTTLVSASSTRGKWARWHTEIDMVVCTLCQRLNVYWLRLLKSLLCQPEASEPVDTQRLIWPSESFVEDSSVFRPRLLKSPFAIQRQASLMACIDQHGHLHPLLKTQCLSTETTLVSPLSSRDNKVRWHAETNMVVCTLCRRLNVCRLKLLKSPLVI